MGVEGQSSAVKVTITPADNPDPSPSPSNPSGPSGGSGSVGGGGSSTPSSNVVVKSASNGKVSVSPTSPKKGDKVTITLKPNEGYKGTLVVTDKDGNELELTDLGNNKFSFVMPAGKVTVNATFTPVDEEAENPFTDVASGSYYYDAVLWAVEKGITAGTSATTFSPDMTCTRAQAVTFLYRYEKSPEVSGSNAFADVSSSAYYANAVQWAVNENVTAGTGANTFSPDMTCTRAQIVTFLYRDMAK